MRKTLSEAATQIKLGYKVLRLVFASSPKYATFYFLANIVNSTIPAISFYLGKLLIDAIVSAIKTPDSAHILAIVYISLMTLLIRLGNQFSSSLAHHGYELMKDVFGKFITRSVLEKATSLDVSYFEDPKFHDQMEKVRNGMEFRPINAMDEAMEIFSSTIGSISLVFILFRLGFWVPIVILAAALPWFFFRLQHSRWTYWITDSRTPESRQINQISWLTTSKAASAEIKAFVGVKKYLLSISDRLYDQFIKQNQLLSRKSWSIDFALDVISEIIYFAIAIYAAIKTVLGALTLGDLTMLTGTVRQFQSNFEGIFMTMARFYENNLFLQNYFDFMSLQPKITNVAHPKFINSSKPLMVEFKNVSFGYDRSKLILKKINLTISDAKNFALVGENGAGKTTLVKLLLRLYDATSGQILVNGTDIREIDLEDLRYNIGVIFQDFMHYEMSARENIGFGDARYVNNIGKIRKAARLSGAAEFIEAFPEKYRTMLGRNWEKGEELSGGQWQKIALARAFFKDAKILIMDEPTSALDPKSEYEVFKNLIAHTKNKSLILISHRFSTVRLASEIIVLHKGELTEQGSHEDLMKKDGHYAKLYDLQAKWYR